MKKKIITSSLGLFLLISNGVNAAIIMNSVNEFSNVQGQDGWSYGYYNGNHVNAFTPDDFEEMTQFNASTWWVQEGAGGFFTSLNATGGHPNGITTSGGRQSINHWAVRRWTSDSMGILNLSGSLSKESSGGNGIVGHIFVDGAEVFSQYTSSTLDFNYSFDVNVGIGSVIDIAFDPLNSEDFSDGSFFSATGDLSPTTVPTPAIVWLLSTGLMGFIGMRKKSSNL